jgi:hypothetical protein
MKKIVLIFMFIQNISIGFTQEQENIIDLGISILGFSFQNDKSGIIYDHNQTIYSDSFRGYYFGVILRNYIVKASIIGNFNNSIDEVNRRLLQYKDMVESQNWIFLKNMSNYAIYQRNGIYLIIRFPQVVEIGKIFTSILIIEDFSIFQ